MPSGRCLDSIKRRGPAVDLAAVKMDFHYDDWWPEVRDKLNRSLRGWSNYFGYGSRGKAYRSVDQYVFERVRRFLVRRHKVQGRGNRRFTFDVIHRELGVLCLQRLPRVAPSRASR